MAFISREVLPGVHHIQDCMGVCCTLLVGEERALLVDAGYGLEDVAAYVRTLTSLPVTLWLTHGHHDHALGARWFDAVRPHPADRDVYALYTNAASVVRTGTMAADGRRYVLRDAFAGTRPGAAIRWAMMTRAEPTLDGDKVMLRQGGKTLTLTQCGAQKGAWSVAEPKGPNEWDSPNKGCSQLTFKVKADASGEARLGVTFTRE